jgi:hypothetical protein
MNTATNQPLILNLGERRGTARRMSAWGIYAQPQGLERDEGLRNDGRRSSKGDDVSNRTGCGSTAKRAVFEIVRARVVVSSMRRHLHLIGGRTHFQKKRRTARRHEADRHIGTKQQDYQQQAGKQVSSPRVEQVFPHKPSRPTMTEYAAARQ